MVNKPSFIYDPYPVFSIVILTWSIKPGRHLSTRSTFAKNYTYIQSP